MPHNSTTDTDNGWGWLADTTRPHPAPEHRGAEWAWLHTPRQQPTPRSATPRRHLGLPPRRWLALTGISLAAITLVTAGALTTRHPDQHIAAPAQTAVPPTSSATAPMGGACKGLTGAVVTDGAGDTATLAGIIAGFEHAYYRARSADAAMRLLAPESGITPEALAAGIASIPLGTTHCVAITPLADTTAAVHLVELHPDRHRTDYLQVINTRPGDAGAPVITNIQTAG
ncbi:hypothetical protein [Nocardia wallacei]|uniref:hypothetical protein n=1 Tax=Nocardia wallacei TaxID=480035 RepID=UPI002454724F|nr:hypothetical protein [Nocardia wallacei]